METFKKTIKTFEQKVRALKRSNAVVLSAGFVVNVLGLEVNDVAFSAQVRTFRMCLRAGV